MVDDCHQEPMSTWGRHLPDNIVDYLILFVHDGPKDQEAVLESVRQSALDLAETVAKNHLWQRGNFSLKSTSDNGLVYLQGSTDYGDCIDDEWLIVFILRELTKTHPSLWVRISDGDGEFLLIEAARVLPKWLSPEIDNNRVWIHQGKLLLIQPRPELDSGSSRGLALSEAFGIISNEPELMLHSPEIEAEAFARLQDFPMRIQQSIHHALATVPRKVAHVLHQTPRIVAPAVEAFYLREPTMSPRYKARFPVQDLVTVSVRFTRVLFAQLSSQQFSLPSSWEHAKSQQPSDGRREFKANAYDVGAKLTTGLELAVKDAGYNNNESVKEMAIILEELDRDGDQALPTNQQINGWDGVQRQDDESWLNIDFQDFEDELQGRGRPQTQNGKSSLTDLRRIVSRFQNFLDDRSAGIDGAEIESDDGSGDSLPGSDKDQDTGEDEDEEVILDEVEFARLMKEMSIDEAGNAVQTRPMQSGVHTLPSTISEMEMELKSHGALGLDTGLDMTASSSNSEASRDYHLAKNLLESFKSQAGLAGPAGNMLGMMGVRLPRDEDDDNIEGAQ